MRHWKILFVDDDPSLLAGLERALRKEPFDIRTATSAIDGLRLLASEPFDAVVSDQDMPDTHGAEFLEDVRDRWPDMLRIMLTGRPTLATAVSAVNHGGVFRFLTKPCDPAKLAVTLRHGLEQRDLLRSARKLIDIVREQQSLLSALQGAPPGVAGASKASSASSLLDGASRELPQLIDEFESLVRRAGESASIG